MRAVDGRAEKRVSVRYAGVGRDVDPCGPAVALVAARDVRRETTAALLPFDGFEVPDGKSSVIAEVYPSLFRHRYPKESRTPDEHDAFCVAAWLAETDRRGSRHTPRTPTQAKFLPILKVHDRGAPRWRCDGGACGTQGNKPPPATNQSDTPTMSVIGTGWSRIGEVAGIVVAVISLLLLTLAIGLSLGIGVAVFALLLATGPGAVLGGATGLLGSLALIVALIPFAIVGLIIDAFVLAILVVIVDAGVNLLVNILRTIFPALGPPAGPGFFAEVGQGISRFASGFRRGAGRVIDRAVEIGTGIIEILNPFG